MRPSIILSMLVGLFLLPNTLTWSIPTNLIALPNGLSYRQSPDKCTKKGCCASAEATVEIFTCDGEAEGPGDPGWIGCCNFQPDNFPEDCLEGGKWAGGNITQVCTGPGAANEWVFTTTSSSSAPTLPAPVFLSSSVLETNTVTFVTSTSTWVTWHGDSCPGPTNDCTKTTEIFTETFPETVAISSAGACSAASFHTTQTTFATTTYTSGSRTSVGYATATVTVKETSTATAAASPTSTCVAYLQRGCPKFAERAAIAVAIAAGFLFVLGALFAYFRYKGNKAKAAKAKHDNELIVLRELLYQGHITRQQIDDMPKSEPERADYLRLAAAGGLPRPEDSDVIRPEVSTTRAADGAVVDAAFDSHDYIDEYGNGGPRAVVLDDVEGNGDNKLRLVKGELVTNIEMLDNDWWLGTDSKGANGIFPSNCVELVEDKPIPNRNSMESLMRPLSNRSSMNSMTPSERSRENHERQEENLARARNSGVRYIDGKHVDLPPRPDTRLRVVNPDLVDDSSDDDEQKVPLMSEETPSTGDTTDGLRRRSEPIFSPSNPSEGRPRVAKGISFSPSSPDFELDEIPQNLEPVRSRSTPESSYVVAHSPGFNFDGSLSADPNLGGSIFPRDLGDLSLHPPPAMNFAPPPTKFLTKAEAKAKALAEAKGGKSSKKQRK